MEKIFIMTKHHLIIGFVLINLFFMPNCAVSEDFSRKQYLYVGGYVKDEFFMSTFVRYYPDAEPVGEKCPYGCPYTLELLDSENKIIANHKFGTQEAHFSMTEGPHIIQDSGLFSFSIPYPSQTRKLIVIKNEEILYEQVRSPHSPNVKITKPQNGAEVKGIIDVEWSSEDVDGSPISCQFESSNNGGKDWSPFTSFTQKKNFQVDAKYFYALGDEVVLRVVCSDGLNGSMDSIKVLVGLDQD